MLSCEEWGKCAKIAVYGEIKRHFRLCFELKYSECVGEFFPSSGRNIFVKYSGLFVFEIWIINRAMKLLCLTYYKTRIIKLMWHYFETFMYETYFKYVSQNALNIWQTSNFRFLSSKRRRLSFRYVKKIRSRYPKLECMCYKF